MKEAIDKLIAQLNTILIGKEDKVRLLVANLITGGNVLLEDMPGVGKTIISKALAKLIAATDKGKQVTFSRIQATPDLLPYDITGVDVYDPEKKQFVFKPGPIFTEILLADELNRTTPKVQSALLEAMAEKQVTIGKKTYKLPEIFFVIATQNPVETEGTYPLPAAQLDRFSCCLKFGYPNFDHELSILQQGKSEIRLPSLKPVITAKQLLAVRKSLSKIEIDNKILQAIAKICQRSRSHKDIRLGLSTRAGLMMTDLLRAHAFLEQRSYVTDQDLVDLCVDSWSHRLILFNPQQQSSDVISKITRDEVRKIINH
jgi:MoxR-like ATPase